MFSFDDLCKVYSEELEEIENNRFTLSPDKINKEVPPEIGGVYGLWLDGDLVYIGESGRREQRLHERLKQYAREKDGGVENFRKYFTKLKEEGRPLKRDDFEFSFIAVEDKRLILILETLFIAYFKDKYPKSMIINSN